ncbi:hypothetical protein BH18ACI3_BH18ACI3_17030 [soil metagenome]
MKTIFRFLGLGLVSTAVAAAGTTAGYAQDPCADVDGQTAVYTKFTEAFPKTTIADRKVAIEAGKQFIEKYGSCETVKEQSDYLKAAVPKLEELVVQEGNRIKTASMFARFDSGINSDNADEIYAAGKEILSAQPDNLNIIVPLGVVGMYKSTNENNYKYADDGIRYANLALSKIKSGAVFNKELKGAKSVGALKYEYNKQDAINELTYTLAYLNYYAKKDKKTALPLYYELSQSSGVYKNDPRIYGTIADYYVEQGAPVGEQIAIEIQNRKPDDTAEVLAQKEASIKAKIALFNAYTERALDAYSRAHKVAKSDTPAAKAYKDNLYKIMQGLYKRRFEKDAGIDAYVASTIAKPFPNPTAAVTPVSDPEPATTTGSPAAVVTKPVSSATPKSSPDSSAPLKTPAVTTTAVKAKTVVKKPVVRRKGTR